MFGVTPAFASSVTGVSFTPAGLTQEEVGQWDVYLTATTGLSGGADTITVIAPSGTIFPSTTGAYWVLDPSAGASLLPATSVQLTGSNEATITMPTLMTVSAGDTLDVQILSVTNPAAGTYPASDFSVATSQDTTPVNPASAITFNPSAVSQVSFSPADNTTGASTTWTMDFMAATALTAGTDTITLTGPSGTVFPTSAGNYNVTDTASSTSSVVTSVYSGGGTDSVTLVTPVSVTGGDTVSVVATGVTNPAAGTYPSTDFTIATSKDAADSASSSLDFLEPPNAANSTVSASPTLVAANGTATATVTVTAKDASGTAIDGETVTLAGNSGTNSTITTVSGTTDASGVATFTVTDSTPETVTYTATAGTTAIAQTAQVTFAVPSASESTVSASPSEPAANGTATSTITVTVKDASGNPIDGESVTLAGNSGTHSTITTVSGTTDASGVATFTATDSIPETVTYTATAGTTAIAQTAQVTFAVPSASESTVSASPSEPAANGTATSTITVMVKDASGTAIDGESVTLTGNSGTYSTITAVSATTNASGVATFTVTDSTAEVVTYTATAGTTQITQTAQVTFAVPGAASSTVTASAPASNGDGTSSALVTVTVKDASGNPIDGESVSLAGNPGTSSAIAAISATTNASGVATFEVRGSSETVTYTATAGSTTITQTAQVTFAAAHPTSQGSTPDGLVGPSGGALTFGPITLIVPANAVSQGHTETVNVQNPVEGVLGSANSQVINIKIALDGTTVLSSLPTPDIAFLRVTSFGSGSGGGNCGSPGTFPGEVCTYTGDNIVVMMYNDAWHYVPSVLEPDGTVAFNVIGSGDYAIIKGAPSFSDVPSGYWADSAIETVSGAQIATGYPDGTFRPDATVTRAQFVKMLDLVLNLQAGGSSATSFTDVPAGAWYAPYVAAAVQAGVIQGTSATTFSPDAPVTREEMAVILTRALKLTGTHALTFTDASRIAAWAKSGVEAAVSAGYLKGFSNGGFAPLAVATRAQTATVLARVMSQLAPKVDP